MKPGKAYRKDYYIKISILLDQYYLVILAQWVFSSLSSTIDFVWKMYVLLILQVDTTTLI